GVLRWWFVRVRATLGDAGGVGIIQCLGQCAGASPAAHVRGYDHQVVVILALDIGNDQRRGVDVVYRDIEEALDLVGVQVNGDNAIDADAGDHVGDHFCSDRYTRGTHATILARVTEVRHHCGDTTGGGATQCVGHHHQFHQVVVGRVAGRLDDEHVLAAHVLMDFHCHFAVAEGANVGGAERLVQVTHHGLGELGGSVSGKDDELGHGDSHGLCGEFGGASLQEIHARGMAFVALMTNKQTRSPDGE